MFCTNLPQIFGTWNCVHLSLRRFRHLTLCLCRDWSILRLSGLSACLQPEATAPLKTDNCFKEPNNKIYFNTLSTTLMCNHKARGGEGGQSGCKNILQLALIVSASVLLLLSPRQAKNTTESTHSKFPLSPFPLIKLPSQWLIARPDLCLVSGLSPHLCLLCNSC